MNSVDIQGIVSAKTGEPLVQFRVTDEKNEQIAGWQATVADAREMAQQIVEAAMNATYDAALVSWCKEMWPEDHMEKAAGMLLAVRKHRADTWGLPDNPEEWR